MQFQALIIFVFVQGCCGLVHHVVGFTVDCTHNITVVYSSYRLRLQYHYLEVMGRTDLSG